MGFSTVHVFHLLLPCYVTFLYDFTSIKVECETPVCDYHNKKFTELHELHTLTPLGGGWQGRIQDFGKVGGPGN